MKTRIYKESDITKKAVRDDIKTTIQQGRLVVFPTETVYGIGASALNLKGLKAIFKTKGRPTDNPLIVHVANKKEALNYVTGFNEHAKKLSDSFWPGPLTLIIAKKPVITKEITGGLDTVALRVPANYIAQEVIKISGVPICAPSANISGRPSSTLFEHVMEDFNGKVDIIIDGGKSLIGLESTVVDVTKAVPVILRPGAITYEMIKETLNIDPELGYLKETLGVPKAPGMKYRHYSPKGDLTLVRGDKKKALAYINERIVTNKEKKIKTYVICSLELAPCFLTENRYIISKDSDTKEIATNLYESLRVMDKRGVKKIYLYLSITGRYSEAIFNRLSKASNNNIITF